MGANNSLAWGERLKRLIDRTTTYRLMLYYLLSLFVAALAFAAAGILPYSPVTLLWSLAVILIAAWITNEAFARALGAVKNLESVYITSLILALVLSPVAFMDTGGTLALAAAAALSMASKYVLAWRKKHIFNPAALAIALSAAVFGMPASWWVAGNFTLLPFILLGGLILVYKLRRWDLLLSFSVAALAVIMLISADPLQSIVATFQYSAIFFFAFVMLTEPSTMPTSRIPRIVFGALVGALFVFAPTFGPLHFSPELSLLAGNLFAFLINAKGRYTLSLAARRPLAPGIFEYVFRSDRLPTFASGQYLEWTLADVPYDNRGNRRYFTIASAPEDKTLALGVRFYEKPSAFKRTLAALPVGASVTAVSPAGDFTLPKDTKKKVAFLAGGIGVTPFVSMARHCIAREEKRDAVLLYSSKTAEEVAYEDVFARTQALGWRTVYLISDEVPRMPNAHHGFITADLIKREVPDYADRLFYISGPPPMIDAMKQHLRSLGVSRFNIKTDFFPGLAA